MIRRLTTTALCLLLPMLALAQSDFVVRDMRVEGLQRISEGTVFNYLPINIGDRVDQIRVQESIRALYGQGLFDDIEIRRDGETLIVVVHERPSIESFVIEGNKDIKTEDLTESLRGVGLAKGRTFDQSVLDEVAGFLREQYYDRGKYGVAVETSVIDTPNNTVRIRIDVKEGERAKIRQVNIVGNETLNSIPPIGFPGYDRTIATRRKRSKAILRNCARFTWIRATRIFVLTRHRLQFHQTRKTYL